MATKKTTTKPEEVVVETIVETIKVTPKVKQEPVNTWEIKDRTYILKGNKEPITYTIQSRHTKKYSLLKFLNQLKPYYEHNDLDNINF